MSFSYPYKTRLASQQFRDAMKEPTMTTKIDAVSAARALVAASDALDSEEHKAEAEKLRELSQRVTARIEAYDDALVSLHKLHTAEVASGVSSAPNVEAAAVINGYGHTYDPDVFDDFTPPARAD